MTGDELKAKTLEGFERMFHQGDLTYLDEVTSAGTTDHQDGGVPFCDHLTQVVTTLRTALPDVHFDVHDIVCEGDVVACRSTMTGTHRGRFAMGPLAAVEPAGAQVSVSHMHWFRYEDGKVADLWHVWDTLGLMRQLGLQAPAVRVATPA
jgi:predicted ester cyclase